MLVGQVKTFDAHYEPFYSVVRFSDLRCRILLTLSSIHRNFALMVWEHGLELIAASQARDDVSEGWGLAMKKAHYYLKENNVSTVDDKI